MANRWSHAHGKTSPEVVPFTWQPTTDRSGFTQRPARRRPERSSKRSGGYRRGHAGQALFTRDCGQEVNRRPPS